MLADVDGMSVSSSVCAGYLKLWNYAVKATMVAQNLEGDHELSSDLFRLTDRLKEMEQWRINRKSQNLSQRFDDVRIRIMEKLDDESRDSISKVCVKEIRKSMDTAFNFWFSAAATPVLQPA
jgi:predicted transcriptional regulator